MKTLASHVVTPKKTIPQTKPLDERQVKNSAGGYSYVVNNWDRLRRFLILGSWNGTYYINERKLTKENYDILLQCLNEDAARTVATIVEVSDKGLAPKNDFAIFALAVVAAKGDANAKTLAYKALPSVCRIGTHLFQFMEESKALGRGRGTGFRNAVAAWYQSRPLKNLSEQVVKYRSRNDWSHKDILALVRPTPQSPTEDAIYKWVRTGEWKSEVEMPDVIKGYEAAKTITDPKAMVKLINEYRLVREALPTEALNQPPVWKALLNEMPPTALMRNLGNISKHGLFNDWDNVNKAVSILTSEELLKKQRVHPLQALLAQRVYSSGRSVKGDGVWQVNNKVVDALDEAFYKALTLGESSGKRILVGVDESGSMQTPVVGTPNIKASEAAGVMALVHYAMETNCEVVTFDTSVRSPKMSNKMTIQQAMNIARNGGGTDLSLPVQHAMSKKMVVDAFIIYTDNETWAGSRHAADLFKEYQSRYNKNCKLVVVSMAANGFSVGDPNDPNVLQVVGLDASVPQIINAFIS